MPRAQRDTRGMSKCRMLPYDRILTRPAAIIDSLSIIECASGCSSGVKYDLICIFRKGLTRAPIIIELYIFGSTNRMNSPEKKQII